MGILLYKSYKVLGNVVLTWPTFVSHHQVFAGSWTWIRAKQTTVDKQLAVPPVLALIQHFLNKKISALSYGKKKTLKQMSHSRKYDWAIPK